MERQENQPEAIEEVESGRDENGVAEKVEEAARHEENVESNAQNQEQEAQTADPKEIKHIPRRQRHKYAVTLVEEAKRLVSEADKQLDDCRLLLDEDLRAFEEAKQSLKEAALNEAEALLDELGFAWQSGDELDEPDVVFEAKEEVSPLYVQDVSGGKFGSFVLALLGGAATAAGVMFAFATKAGVHIDFARMPDMTTCKQALGAVAQQLGFGQNEMIGGAITVAAALGVFFLIYGLRTGAKAKKNVAFAQQQLEEAKTYVAKKHDCKVQMDKVDAHIKDAIETLRLYEVILAEQNGKLRRIRFVEGTLDDVNGYHAGSRKVMQETGLLVDAIKGFIATPMSEEGKLSGKSTLFLHRAKNRAQELLDKIYA